MTTQKLSPETVIQLAELVAFPLTDAAMAERIAAGADAAILAVRQQVAAQSSSLFEREPGDFLATLERLADVDLGSAESNAAESVSR